MNIPPLIIGFSALFWGFETGNLLIGCVLALLLEARYFIKERFDFDTEDFVKISDLSSLLLIGSVALVLLNNEATSFLRLTAGWLPLTLSPLIIAQLYSGSDTVTIGTRIGKSKQSHSHRPVDFRVYYIVICLFAAATGNSREPWFFFTAAAIITVLLIANRGKGASSLHFMSLLTGCLVVGYLGSIAFAAGHSYVLHNSFQFLYDYYQSRNADPYKSYINFGDTGQLKFSGKIVMRVESKTSPPSLFREAVYSNYNRGKWSGNRGGYFFLSPVGQQRWNLIDPPHRQGRKLIVEYGLPREKGLLPHPYGGYYLASRTIFRVEQHQSGSVRVVDGAKLLVYEILAESSMTKDDDAPSTIHLALPKEELGALSRVHSQMNIEGSGDKAKLNGLRNYFNDGFTYSLKMVGRGNFDTPLGNFLLERKSGFCEYYATATALLLRYMNIPSRYVTGYAVVEKSPLEDKYIVRDRHAHAWVEAYIDGRWVVVDTTPAEWDLRDAENGSLLEPLWDLLNLLKHKYTLYQVGESADYTPFLTAMVVLMVAFLSIRIYRRMRMERIAVDSEEGRFRHFDRIITPLSPILDSLTALQGPPKRGESISEWALRSGIWTELDQLDFERLYGLHLKNRFDSEEMSEEDRRFFQEGAKRYRNGIEVKKEGQT